MLSGVGSSPSAVSQGQFSSRGSSGPQAVIRMPRRGINCMPEGPTDELQEHILLQLLTSYPNALTPQQLAHSYGTYKIKSKVNSVLYTVLQPAGLVEVAPNSNANPNETRKSWRLTGDAVRLLQEAAEPMGPAATEVMSPAQHNISPVLAMQVPSQAPANAMGVTDRHLDSAALGADILQTATCSVPSTSSAQVQQSSSQDSRPASSRNMFVTAAYSSSSGPALDPKGRQPCSSSNSIPGMDALTAGFENLWRTAAVVSAEVLGLRGSCNSSLGGSRQEASLQGLDSFTLQQHPAQFRSLLLEHLSQLQPSRTEIQAAMDSVHEVIQVLKQGSSSNHALQLNDMNVCVNRVCIAGSLGKGTCLKGSFDADLVLFIDLPAPYKQQVTTLDPQSTHKSSWMARLRRQLGRYCRKELQQLVDVTVGPTAVSCKLVVGGDSYPHMNVKLDLVLAPNLAPTAANNAEAVAAQRSAVLQPMLAVGNWWSLFDSDGHSQPNVPIPFDSHARSVWLQESTTDYIKSASCAIEQQVGVAGVVISTMCLTKAWVRKGLQRDTSPELDYQHMPGFKLELLVLRAAEKWLQDQLHPLQGCAAASASTAGAAVSGHMLDLFLHVLREIQAWADAAQRNKCTNSSAGDLRPVLFCELEGVQRFYASQQAYGLQRALQACDRSGDGWTKGDKCFSQPVVVHPVDPMDNIFADRRFSLPMWQRFKGAAAQLHHDLLHRNWEYIRSRSSLASVIGSSS